MSIPLDRLYHYIESVANEVRGGNVLIYRFRTHGTKNIGNFSPHINYSWINHLLNPQIHCYDQEPLDYNFYQFNGNISPWDYFLKNFKFPPCNLRLDKFNIYDKSILLHSELNSTEVLLYQSSEFIPVYYWSHAIIARDWFRYAKHIDIIKSKKHLKKFLIYNRAWSGTREYRLKFIDLLIDNNLISRCKTSCNSIEPELQIHYSQHQYTNTDWVPKNCLENYTTSTMYNSCSSADFDLDDYQNTEFEVVLETLFEDDRIQLTEKILRPIACGQPFLLVSTPNSLKYLQNYGFKTFSEIFDESYDTITDHKKRMQAVIKTMNDINNWSVDKYNTNMLKIKEITQYNKNYFFSDSFFNLINNELKQNLKKGIQELEQTNTSNTFLSIRKQLSANQECKQMLIENNPRRSRQDIAHVLRHARTYYNRYLKTLNK